MAAIDELASGDGLKIIKPNWPVHLLKNAAVQAFTTTCLGGVSQPPFDGLNLALHVNDNPLDVAHNRQLVKTLTLKEPAWLNQTHSNNIADLSQNPDLTLPVDASITSLKGQVCAVMTADCLPLLVTDVHGQAVAAIHAGWQGLANGIITKTINLMVKRYRVEPANLLVWLGPAISQAHFEIGDEVKAQLMASLFVSLPASLSIDRAEQQLSRCFKQGKKPGKWYGDVYAIAKAQLLGVGVKQVYGGDYCTYADKEVSNRNKFFSHRRATHQGLCGTGRMVSVIGLV